MRRTVSKQNAKSDSKTPVLFRATRNGPGGMHDCLVVFPNQPGTNGADTMACLSYEGHSSCDAGYVTKSTRPAKAGEISQMRAWLRAYGYKNLQPVARASALHRKQRAAKLLWRS